MVDPEMDRLEINVRKIWSEGERGFETYKMGRVFQDRIYLVSNEEGCYSQEAPL